MIRPLALDNEQQQQQRNTTYEDGGSDWTNNNEKKDEELHNLIIRGDGDNSNTNNNEKDEELLHNRDRKNKNNKKRTSITSSAIIAIIAAIGATVFIFIIVGDSGSGSSSSEQATLLLEQQQKHNSSSSKSPTPDSSDDNDTAQQQQQPPDNNEQTQTPIVLTAAKEEEKMEVLFDPQIAWLASFPNSGTSFTMSMVTRATNTSFATNYGLEANYGLRDTPSLPIYGPKYPEGPYMPDPSTSYHHRQLPTPGQYVITKTHCGGYCFNCGPKEYAYGYNNSITAAAASSSISSSSISNNVNATTTTDSIAVNNNETASLPIPISPPIIPPPPLLFLQDCASGHAVDDQGNLMDVSYPPERVAKVIHLIRNPFHNVIARFHLERKHHRDDNTTNDQLWLKNHPDNGTGMSLFCNEIDAIQVRGDKESDFFQSDYFLKKEESEQEQDDISKASFTALRNDDGDHHDATIPGTPSSSKEWNTIINNVPCRGDFFRYVQWHNLLHESLDYLPFKVPVLTVYYENYKEPTFMETAHSILEFLNLEAVPGDKRGNIKWSRFDSRTDYDDFFTQEQKHYIKMFLTTLSSSRVRNDIKHYF